MKAMILAAGLGTRLKPLTDNIPKALIRVKNRPLIACVIDRLKQFGVTEIIINVHHFGEKIIEYIRQEKNFKIRIEVSIEPTLLDTGGGLKKAGWFFDDDKPFILHNVDVLSDINLTRMIEHHRNNDAIATLAVRSRDTTRYLLFDENDLLVGWKSDKKEKLIESIRTISHVNSLSFMGVHVLSPRIFSKFYAKEKFSIIDAYINLAEKNEHIGAFRADSCFWMDLGRPERINKAEQFLKALDN
jgi:NDP-sugar pyrophosphorylase family protein